MKKKSLLVYIFISVLFPILVHGYETCPMKSLPKEGRHTLAEYSNNIGITPRKWCFSPNNLGLFELTYMMNGYNQGENGEGYFFDGKRDGCIAVFDESDIDQKYYAKMCPVGNSRDKYTFDFNGRKSQEFKEFKDLKISRDGKRMMVILTNGNSFGSLIVLGDRNMVLASNTWNFAADINLFDYAYSYFEQGNYFVNYKGVKNGPFPMFASFSGFISGKGPVYRTMAKSEGNVFYVGNTLIDNNSCFERVIVFSQDGKNFAYRDDRDPDCDKKPGKNSIFLDGRELKNTASLNSDSDPFMFSENGKLCYVSQVGAQRYFECYGKRIEIGKEDIIKVKTNSKGFALLVSGLSTQNKRYSEIILNGERMGKIYGELLPNKYAFELSDDGRNVFFADALVPKDVKTAYINKNKLPANLISAGFASDGGVIIILDNKDGTRGIYKNNKLLIKAKNGNELVYLNSSWTKMIVSQHSTDKEETKFFNGSTQIGKVYPFNIEARVSDDGKYLIVIFMQNGKVLKDVIKITK